MAWQPACPLPDFHQKRLIFNRLSQPGQVHVYSTECRAGERLRVQLFVPVLPLGGSVVPGFAVVAQSLPYSADAQLPIELPAGFSAVVAPPPTELLLPVQGCADRCALLSRSDHRHPDAGERALLSGGLEPAQSHGQVRAASRASLALALDLLDPGPPLLVADSRLVWPGSYGGLCGRRGCAGRRIHGLAPGASPLASCIICGLIQSMVLIALSLYSFERKSMRIILYLGKGGVGKTTVAAASAVRSADLGYRTLVVSTDIAHSLADSLDVPLTGLPTEVAPNLFAQEINVLDEIREHWGEMQGYVGNLLRGQGMSKAIAEEMAVIPGMEEIVSLLHINKQAKEGNFDRVIVDAAPTGETIRLLTMPESFQWYMGRLMGWGDATTMLHGRPGQALHARQGCLYESGQSG